MKVMLLRFLFVAALIEGSVAFAAGESISVNVLGTGNSIKTAGGTSGLHPVLNARWNEVGPSKTTVTLNTATDALGEATSLSLSVTAGGAWRQSRNGYDAMMGYYADGPFSLTATAIPYEQYDLYLYFNSDLGDTYRWEPVQIGDAYYTYASGETGGAATLGDADAFWGKNAQAGMTLGVNVMKIEGLTQTDLTVQIAHRRNEKSALGNIAGFQIVDTTPEISLTRVLTADADWHEAAWTTETGLTNQPWRDGVAAYVTVPAGCTLTLTQPVVAEKVVLSGTGTFASSAAAHTLTPESGLIIASTLTQTFTITAALAAPDGGDFMLFANGEFAGGNPGMTHFQPIALTASTLRIRSGVVRVLGMLTHDAAIILDGGGLLDDNQNIVFTKELQIGEHDSGYRTYGSSATAALAGIIRNETGHATAGSLTHDDGGTLNVTGDISGYTGALVNNAGTLIIKDTAITSSANQLTSTRSVLAYEVPEGVAITYPGRINGGSTFRKIGAGVLSLTNQCQGGGILDVARGTLIIEPDAQWYTGNWYKDDDRIQVSGGGILAFRRNWDYGAALGNLGNNAQCIKLNNGTLRFETNTSSPRAFSFAAGGATIEVAEGVTYTKSAGSRESENAIRATENDAVLTLAGAGTGILNDTIPVASDWGTTNMAVRVTGSNWSMNGTYTYLQGTTVEEGGVLRGTGTFTGSAVTVSGTIETGLTADSLVLNNGSIILIDPERMLTINTAFTVGGTIAVILSDAPSPPHEPVAFATLPEGISIDPYAFTVSGFASVNRYAVRQDGRTLSIALKHGTRISLY